MSSGHLSDSYQLRQGAGRFARRGVGVLLAAIGVALLTLVILVLPAYGLLMCVWMHVPLSSLLVTLGPVGIASLLVANLCFAGTRRMWGRARGNGGH